jgi:hypothetical protein
MCDAISGGTAPQLPVSAWRAVAAAPSNRLLQCAAGVALHAVALLFHQHGSSMRYICAYTERVDRSLHVWVQAYCAAGASTAHTHACLVPCALLNSSRLYCPSAQAAAALPMLLE